MANYMMALFAKEKDEFGNSVLKRYIFFEEKNDENAKQKTKSIIKDIVEYELLLTQQTPVDSYMQSVREDVLQLKKAIKNNLAKEVERISAEWLQDTRTMKIL